MDMIKMSSILLASLFFLGCATDWFTKREPEGGIINVEPPAKSDKNDASAERWRALDQSISELHSEVEDLKSRLRNIPARPPLTAHKFPNEMFLCGERIPLEDKKVWQNLDREFLIALNYEAQVLLWMKRARQYFPFIEKRLKETGLPDDLKYIAVTESALRPYAVSSSGAAGIWQFIPSTGEEYGMRMDQGVDERFDFFKATEGALAYLKSLHEEFGSWTLAMAAYNAGEIRIRREIELQRTNKYFYLDLPPETERYVYKIAVAKIILSDPKQYGFRLDEKEFYDPLLVERVQIELTQALPMMDVARAVGFYYKEIRELNPHFSEETIPPGTHFLNLPPGTSLSFWAFFSDWKKGLECK